MKISSNVSTMHCTMSDKVPQALNQEFDASFATISSGGSVFSGNINVGGSGNTAHYYNLPADSTSRELIQYGAEAQSWAIEIGIFSSK